MKASRLLPFVAAFLPAAASAFIIIPPETAKEYVNTVTGHYVLVRDRSERAAIEAGAAGPGWKTTGLEFNVGLPMELGRDGAVCRFYSPGANSHFHTGFADECNGLRSTNRDWLFEKVDFMVTMPRNGSCEGSARPVHRFFGGPAGVTNHRYSADPEVRTEMTARGWAYEGVAFCTGSAHKGTEKRYDLYDGVPAPTSECEDERLNIGACVALNQLPRMTNVVQEFLPPWYVVRNPEYPLEASALTGTGGQRLYSAQPLGPQVSLGSHSFVQVGGTFGIHVNSLQRTQGDLSSINPLYQFTTAAPLPGQVDRRVFPWGDGRDNHLEISFELKVRTLRRNDPQSHAYGHPTLQFIDRTTGQHLYITLGTYGSVPFDGPDYLARDAGTGRVIVSTTFRENPSFGKRLSGEVIVCPGFGACNLAATEAFGFRIDLAAFRAVLQRARTLAPELSGNPQDYHLANFHFNNEVYRDGELGLTLSRYVLQIFER